MKLALLDHLSCPECESNLTLTTFKEGSESGEVEVEEGILTCSRTDHWYIIVNYIPRMLPDAINDFPNFEKTYAAKLPSQKNNRISNNTFKALQEKTKESFGFEWQKWNRFGWDDEVPVQTTRAIFDYKVMFNKEELTGKLLLDAGCGNGRYTNIAREYGAEVVGIDLSRAVDEAFKNLKNDPKIHFVQGDLFKLPFKKRTFDFIFSNGVLMHTGDAKKAFLSLASRLNDHGKITIHLYHKGNIIYEFNDWWLRLITTRLSLKKAYTFSIFLTKIAKALPKKFVMYGLNMFFRIEPHEHYVFDWYTAPIATHHTYKQVYGWLRDAHVFLIADHNATRHPFRRLLFPFQFLTVKAGKDLVPLNEVQHTTS